MWGGVGNANIKDLTASREVWGARRSWGFESLWGGVGNANTWDLRAPGKCGGHADPEDLRACGQVWAMQILRIYALPWKCGGHADPEDLRACGEAWAMQILRI